MIWFTPPTSKRSLFSNEEADETTFEHQIVRHPGVCLHCELDTKGRSVKRALQTGEALEAPRRELTE